MKEKSRTQNALKNSTIALECQIVYIVISFICRTVFTKLLGAEYLGINGLFSNIITMLSFAELGIGSALVYRMYAPIANNDNNKLMLWLALYKKAYRYIVLIIASIGLLITPFIGFIVEAPAVDENLYLLYLLYLMDTVISYVYVYKKSLLIADQKNYVVSIFAQIFNILMNILQILYLVIRKDFIGYCLIRSFCTLLNNIVCAKYVNKHYNFDKPKGKLSKEDIVSLKNDVLGLVLRNIAGVSFCGTDNVVISKFIGISTVGIVSNYTLLISTFNGIMNKIFQSITATLGNLVCEEDSEHIERTLKRMFFFNTLMYGYVCIGMTLLMQEFITDIWFSKVYFLPSEVIFVMMLELFLRGIHYPVFVLRTAAGHFRELKCVNIISAIINIALDIILVQKIGLTGVYIATIVGYMIQRISDVYVVYKNTFNISFVFYYKFFLKYVMFILTVFLSLKVLLRFIPSSNIIYFISKIIMITIVYGVMFILCFKHTEEYQYYKNIIKKKLGRNN